MGGYRKVSLWAQGSNYLGNACLILNFFLIGLFPRVTPLDFDPFLSVQIVMYLSLLLLTLSRVLTQQISKMPIFYSSSVCRLHINSQTFCHLVMTRNPGAPLVPLTPPCSTFMAIHGHLVNHHISLDSVTISLFAFLLLIWQSETRTKEIWLFDKLACLYQPCHRPPGQPAC